MTELVRQQQKDVAADSFNRNFTSDQWSLDEKFVLGSRVLARHGHAESLFGQFSVRLHDGTFLSQRFGCGLDETGMDDLIAFDHDLNVVRGGGPAHPGLRFHVAIYDKRPDVKVIVHTHPPYTVALSMTGRPLRPASMDSAMFYGDVAYLDHWPGVPEADEEAEIISAALKDSYTVLLANHGLLAVGDTIQQAVYYAVFFERAARAQCRAAAIGPIQDVIDVHGREAFDAMNRPGWINANFDYLCRKELARDPAVLAARPASEKM